MSLSPKSKRVDASFKSKGDVSFWVSDSASESCMGCERKFGVLLRKHHCRQCGLLFCDKCLEFKKLLPELSYTDLQKVCKKCLTRAVKSAKEQEEEKKLVAENDDFVFVTSADGSSPVRSTLSEIDVSALCSPKKNEASSPQNSNVSPKRPNSLTRFQENSKARSGSSELEEIWEKRKIKTEDIISPESSLVLVKHEEIREVKSLKVVSDEKNELAAFLSSRRDLPGEQVFENIVQGHKSQNYNSQNELVPVEIKEHVVMQMKKEIDDKIVMVKKEVEEKKNVLYSITQAAHPHNNLALNCCTNVIKSEDNSLNEVRSTYSKISNIAKPTLSLPPICMLKYLSLSSYDSDDKIEIIVKTKRGNVQEANEEMKCSITKKEAKDVVVNKEVVVSTQNKVENLIVEKNEKKDIVENKGEKLMMEYVEEKVKENFDSPILAPTFPSFSLRQDSQKITAPRHPSFPPFSFLPIISTSPPTLLSSSLTTFSDTINSITEEKPISPPQMEVKDDEVYIGIKEETNGFGISESKLEEMKKEKERQKKESLERYYTSLEKKKAKEQKEKSISTAIPSSADNKNALVKRRFSQPTVNKTNSNSVKEFDSSNIKPVLPINTPCNLTATTNISTNNEKKRRATTSSIADMSNVINKKFPINKFELLLSDEEDDKYKRKGKKRYQRKKGEEGRDNENADKKEEDGEKEREKKNREKNTDNNENVVITDNGDIKVQKNNENEGYGEKGTQRKKSVGFVNKSETKENIVNNNIKLNKKTASDNKSKTSVSSNDKCKRLKIAFLHPDLGLGGAERLVIDAALGLKSLGHEVVIYTSRFDPKRAFKETIDGSITIKHIDSFIPRHLFGKFHVILAMIRAVCLALNVVNEDCNYNVIICDQISAYVPFVKQISKVLFYCHFPDKLLSTGDLNLSGSDIWTLKRIYRIIPDYIEERCTAAADKVVVNSRFTQKIVSSAFPSLSQTSILYPSLHTINLDTLLLLAKDTGEKRGASKKEIVFLSINRFERKKNIKLAVEALIVLREKMGENKFKSENIKLIIAGGYDLSVKENVDYCKELEDMVVKEKLKDCVSFVKSFDDIQKAELLYHCICVLYTPANEHFGIVPLEVGAACKPVIAVNSGGPLETIEDGKTGFLVPQTAEAFSDAMLKFVKDANLSKIMGKFGRQRVLAQFSFESFSQQLSSYCLQLDNKRKGNTAILHYFAISVLAKMYDVSFFILPLAFLVIIFIFIYFS